MPLAEDVQLDQLASVTHGFVGADLEAAGVPPAGIALTAVCTSSDARFFSHRREHGLTGRHLAIAWRQAG